MTTKNQNKTITVVLEAYASTCDCDGPDFAYTEVNQTFVERCEKMVQLCNEHQLNSINYSGYPEWGPGDIEEDLRLQNGEIVVTANGSIWFTDNPKNSNYAIETRAINAKELSQAFLDAADGETVFLTEKEDVIELFKDEVSEREITTA